MVFLDRFNLKKEFNKNTEDQFYSLKRYLINRNEIGEYFIKRIGNRILF